MEIDKLTVDGLSFDNLDHHSYKDKAELENLYKLYKENSLKPTAKENLIINPKVAYTISSEDIVSNIPHAWIKQESTRKIYGEITRLSLQNPVSNLNWDYLYFINPSVFRPAAIAFEKSQLAVRGTNLKPSYCPHLKGTTAYKNFWKEEYRRCKYGYEPIVDGKPCGIRIPGEFYFYLNYCIIKKIKELPNGRSLDVEGFPDFLAVDYYYFKELEARERPELYNLDRDYKRSVVLVKGRRSGFSYKAAAGCLWITCFNKKARVGVASEPNSKDATDAVKCVRKCIPILDHLSNFTPFGRTEPGDPKQNGGWKHEVMQDTNEYVNITLGIFNTRTKEKKGRQSSIFTMSLSKDDAASGDGLNRLYFEEAGKTHNVDKAWTFSRETMKAGSLFRGIAVIFGCVTENNTVLLDNGKRISPKDVKPGDKIVSYDGKNITSNEIDYKTKPKKKKCIRITTNTGTVIECSEDHPILWSHKNYRYSVRNTNDNGERTWHGSIKKAAFHAASLIKKNDQIAVADSIPLFGKEKMWSPRLVGLLIGDGSYGFDKTPVLSSCDSEINEFVYKTCNAVLEKEYLTKDGRLYKETRIKNITRQLRELGIYGQVSYKKRLPTDIDKYDKFSVCELIAGLFDSDGHVSLSEKSKNITFTSCSEVLVYELKNLLIKLGIHCNISTIKNTKKRERSIKDKSIYYRLNICDIVSINRFNDNIHLLVNKKRRTLERIITEKYVSKFTNEIVMVNANGGRKKANLEYLENIRFETVKSIEDIGEQYIYNFRVEVNHTYVVSNVITHNTGGEMKSSSGKAGSSKAFSTLFYSPKGAELGAYKNIYEYKEMPNDECGLFIPSLWASFGSHVYIDGVRYDAVDKQGNAHFWVADLYINKQRFEKRPPAGDQEEYNRFLTQICKTPSEAFLTSAGNVFAGPDLVAMQADIKNSPGGFSKFRIAGNLVDTGDKIIFNPDIEGKLQPITTMYADNSNKEGALLIYEQPIYKGPKVLDDAYIITVDSIAINNSMGESYNSVHVLRTPLYSDIMGPERIVATYFGRPHYNPLEYLYDLLYKLSKYYNAKITYENDRDGGIFNHFTKRGWLGMLYTYPATVISKHIPDSKTLVRRFGHSMSSDKHKYIGELYLAEWLTEKIPGYTGIDKHGNIVTVNERKHLHLLCDELTIEQLIDYSRTGNYDAVLSLMGAIIQFKDKFNFAEGEEYSPYTERVNKEIVDFYKSKYVNNNNNYPSQYDWNEYLV